MQGFLLAILTIASRVPQERLGSDSRCWIPGKSLTAGQVSKQPQQQSQIHGAEIKRPSQQQRPFMGFAKLVSENRHRVEQALRGRYGNEAAMANQGHTACQG